MAVFLEWLAPATHDCAAWPNPFICIIICTCNVCNLLIGASLSEPHTNRVYEKIAVLLCFSHFRVEFQMRKFHKLANVFVENSCHAIV